MHNKTIKSLQTSYSIEIKSLRNQYEKVVEEFENYRKFNEKLTAMFIDEVRHFSEARFENQDFSAA